MASLVEKTGTSGRGGIFVAEQSSLIERRHFPVPRCPSLPSPVASTERGGAGVLLLRLGPGIAKCVLSIKQVLGKLAGSSGPLRRDDPCILGLRGPLLASHGRTAAIGRPITPSAAAESPSDPGFYTEPPVR